MESMHFWPKLEIRIIMWSLEFKLEMLGQNTDITTKTMDMLNLQIIEFQEPICL